MDIYIINGPNLNLLGKRETAVYGAKSFDEYFPVLQEKYPDTKLMYFQSNSESEIIDKIHEIGFEADGIILNAGAYTHTSVAIRDAIAAISAPVIEVHISNVYQREDFRHRSYISAVCKGVIAGFGMSSYRLAVEYFMGQSQGTS